MQEIQQLSDTRVFEVYAMAGSSRRRRFACMRAPIRGLPQKRTDRTTFPQHKPHLNLVPPNVALVCASRCSHRHFAGASR